MPNKKIAVMQPYLFPYIGYFQLINAVDAYVLYDDVQWIRGWINRHTILQNGEETKVTLAVDKHGSRDLINQVSFTSNPELKADYLNKIANAYRHAPYFKETFSLIEDVINYENRNVPKLIEYSLRQLNARLGITTELLFSSDIDYNRDVNAQSKIIDITQKLNGETYINNINGQHLYNREDFAAQNLTLKFLEKEIEAYPQFGKEFVPFLSIIDVLMFNDVDTVKNMVTKGKLV